MFKFIGTTFNPVVGCGHGCYGGNCWARKLFQLRRKTYHFDWDFSEPHVFPERLKQIPKLRGNVFVCVVGDTKILMANGSNREAKEIRIGSRIAGFFNGTPIPTVVTAISQTRTNSLCRVVTSQGELQCSGSHRLLTPNGYLEANKLKYGDRVLFLYRSNTRTSSKAITPDKMVGQDKKMCHLPVSSISIGTGLLGRNNRWRGNYFIPEVDQGLLPSYRGDYEYRCASDRLVASNLLAESRQMQERSSSPIFESGIDRFWHCAIPRKIRTISNLKEASVPTRFRVYISKKTTEMERSTNQEDVGVDKGSERPQFAWARVKSLETEGSREILYDFSTYSRNFIANGFVVHNCDMGDMFCELVPSRWIGAVLRACQGNREALFFFETKNPARYSKFLDQFPKNSVLSTTVETNRDEYTSWKAPSRASRVLAMKELAWPRKHVSVEPIMDFDMDPFVEIIRSIGPELVSVGYDNYKSGLVEPSLEKTTSFIEQLETFTKVERKELRRGTNE